MTSTICSPSSAAIWRSPTAASNPGAKPRASGLRAPIANAAGGAQRAAMLTQRLLAFARRQPLDPRVSNVNQLIGGMADFFKRTLGENIELDIKGGAGLWPVEVDPSQMEAAILNLVVNAKDAMAGRGQADHRDRQHLHRRQLLAAERRGTRRRICPDRGERYRLRHVARGAGEGIRPVLHHQAAGAGHRAWPEPGLRLRQAVRRARQDQQRNRRRARPSGSICRARMRRRRDRGERRRAGGRRQRRAKASWWSRTRPTSVPIWWRPCAI